MFFQGSVLLRDAYNRVSTRKYELEAADFVTALANMALFVIDLAALTDADVLRSIVAQKVEVTDSVTAGANIDTGLTLSFDLGAGKSAAHKVPAPVASIFDANGVADLTDALVSDYVANFTSGAFLISDGETAVGVNSGMLDK